MSWSLNIGTIAGTAVRVHITFLLFLVWIFAADYASGGPDEAWTGLLFMLLLSTGIVWLVERGGALRVAIASVLFLVAGAFVEFWWFGVLSCIGAWAVCRQPTPGRLGLWTLATAALARRVIGLSPLAALQVGSLICLAGLAGDLGASWFKRRAGIKDYGRVLPQHGGILDRFDSFLPALATSGLWFHFQTGPV